MATFRKLAVVLLVAVATTGCSSFSGGSLSGWIPGWPKKQDQGLSWTTPDLSKTYGNNRIGAERGATIEPRTEMPKPQEEGRIARMRSAVTQSGPVKAVTSVFNRNAATTAVAAAEPAFNPKTDGGSVFVGLAKLQESQGNVAAAAEAYERALQADSSSLEALMGYARLQDRQGNFPRATQLYQTAVRLHPNDAPALNDLGLCLSRQGKKVEAQAALAQAVNLKSDRTLYRNNLAKLLVDVGQPQLALDHLLAVHAPPVAHYNLGYLLQQKNEIGLARQAFARALELDPNLADAPVAGDARRPAGGRGAAVARRQPGSICSGHASSGGIAGRHTGSACRCAARQHRLWLLLAEPVLEVIPKADAKPQAEASAGGFAIPENNSYISTRTPCFFSSAIWASALSKGLPASQTRRKGAKFFGPAASSAAALASGARSLILFRSIISMFSRFCLASGVMSSIALSLNFSSERLVTSDSGLRS